MRLDGGEWKSLVVGTGFDHSVSKTTHNFHQKMKMNLQYFCTFMYIWWLLKFWGFFCGKLTKPSRLARTFQLVSQQSLSSINNKNPKILTKRPPVATTFPSGTQRHHWGSGILGYTFGSSIQAWAIPPPSWGSAASVTTGSLYSLQWASPPSTLQKRHLHSLFYYCILRIRPKQVLFDES